MGIIFTVMTISDTMLQNQAFREWLRACEVEIPEDVTPSRWPTIRELKSVLESLENCTVSYHIIAPDLHIEIRDDTYVPPDPKTISRQDMFIHGYSGSDDGEQPFHFDKLHHEEIALTVLKRLSVFCGTFLVTFNGEMPQFITP